MCALNFVILLKFPHFLSCLTTHEVTRKFSSYDNDLVLFHLRWKETRPTNQKKSRSILWVVVVLMKLVVLNLCWKSDYELGFYSNQFWGLPKLPCFHKTLKSISVRKSWNYCPSASSNHDLPLNHRLKKCYSISNHCEIFSDLVNGLGFYKM